jgi:ribose 5-phosphate isomerase B
MVANRYSNVRATVYYDGPREILDLSKEHNKANILSIGARFVNVEYLIDVVEY